MSTQMPDDERKGSLFDAMGDKEAATAERDEMTQKIEAQVEMLRQGAPVIGKSPWSNYISRVTSDGASYARWKADISRNALELSPKLVPIPLQRVGDQQRKAFDNMAREDTEEATLIPMLAHNFFMFTPSLLMLMLSSASAKEMLKLRKCCFDVARLWRTAENEETRSMMRQNLMMLEDAYAAELERAEQADEETFPTCMIAVEVIVHYRRLMNMIRETRGFAGIDEERAEEMAILMHRCEKEMARETRKLFLRNRLEATLDPIIRQLRRVGSVYDLGGVDVNQFHCDLIDNTIEYVRIMETWLLRMAGPHYPQQFHFYHLSSPQMPLQDGLSHEEMANARNIRSVAYQARIARDPYGWPEFQRTKSPFGTLAAGLNWPDKPALPQMDRVSTACSMIACALAIAQSHHKADLKRAHLELIKCTHEQPSKRRFECMVLLPNEDCGTGEEMPVIVQGNPALVYQ